MWTLKISSFFTSATFAAFDRHLTNFVFYTTLSIYTCMACMERNVSTWRYYHLWNTHLPNIHLIDWFIMGNGILQITLAIPRVFNFQFLLQSHQNITARSMKNSDERWLYYQFSLIPFELGIERDKRNRNGGEKLPFIQKLRSWLGSCKGYNLMPVQCVV